MAVDAFADWLARGRAHLAEGRPIDAIPCLRRAAREDPHSPVPNFHLGEAFWTLGLADDAVHAWRLSARLAASFLPPRLALVEVAMTRGEFANALEAAREAAALVPADARARATMLAAAAATGDRAAVAAAAEIFASDPTLAHAPSLATALATALAEIHECDERRSLLAVLAPHTATLPAALLAALIENDCALPVDVVSRRWTLADLGFLRRVAVAAQRGDPSVASDLAVGYSALHGSLPRPPVPLMWPRRTAGRALRVAWIMPAMNDPGWASAQSALIRSAAAIPAATPSLVILCVDDAAAVRDALKALVPSGTDYVAMRSPADAAEAKMLAARDCDVLIDAAGLTADTAAMLCARPARANWALAAGLPIHRAPLVDRSFANGNELLEALRVLDARTGDEVGAPLAAAELAQRWDAAVRAHQQGDLDAASAGYEEVLAVAPGFAPALHLSAEIALTRNDSVRAGEALAAAVAAAPDFLQARLAAADHALAQRDAGRAMLLVDEGLARTPHDVALLRLAGVVHLARRDAAAAEAAFRHALLFAPADADVHFQHGAALQRIGDAQAAARAYQRALTLRPDMTAADFNLGTLFQQQGNHQAAAAAYVQVLAADPTHVAAYKHLGEALLASGQIDAWRANFHAFEQHCPTAMPLAVYALEACQHEADFDRLDRYLDGLRGDEFHARDEQELADCLEELLYLLLFFDVEASLLLRLSQAYDAVAPKVYGAPMAPPAIRAPGPLRIGYLSGDLRNHVMGKMIWQAVAHHDHAQFECFFYSNSSERDEWTLRFEAVAKRFIPIASLDDAAAAELIAADDLDILVDLSTHTRGARAGVLARKPARVQITHVASAGTVGLSQIDYKLTDRHADVPANQEFQIERLLPMDGCVFPFRHVAPAAQHPFIRGELGIADDTVVIGAFVTPMKLSRRCLRLWRDVLARVPRARLAFSPTDPALRPTFLRLIATVGIAADRVFFLPQGRDDAQNQARYHLVDFVLDTMPFGGVNGTIEALDMGVPVVTLVGRKHGERMTYSILANLGVTATIAQTGRDFVDIAVRLADDPPFRAEVRAQIVAGLANSALTDMSAHTRHLEAAYREALAEHAPEALAASAAR
ncbi:MAG: tetratricopeptide repeat protein [Burkholderiales bacterium]|nr:tetratricopeptide repeat protein [Burkholderiales bacterium]